MQQGTERYRLVVRRGPQPNQVYELTDEVISLGRDVTNDLVINDREVSRHHLRFTRGQDGYTIEDLGSTNGTFINGKRVSGASSLKNGDMLGLGETVTLGYEVVRGDMPAPAGSPPAEQPQNPYQSAPDDVYRPPAQQPAAADPYQQPAQQPAADPYQQPQPDSYQQQQPAYQQAGGYQQQQPPQQDPYGGYNPPPPPGYDYGSDPYKTREDGNNTTRLFLFGCLGLMIFCCCCTVGSVVLVDTLCLYESLPFVPDVLNALGVPIGCTPAF